MSNDQIILQVSSGEIMGPAWYDRYLVGTVAFNGKLPEPCSYTIAFSVKKCERRPNHNQVRMPFNASAPGEQRLVGRQNSRQAISAA